ncbi:MAG TPA: hypothetical protein VJV21_07410 [Pyrinomonadaceae bacterium]|nr:hypothetical protein [Pyrinomonadaceae bacterium]
MELSGEEKKLQALFSELKAADEETAPRFARMWNGATLKPRRAFVFNPAFVAGMVILVCAVISLAVWSRYRQQTEPAVVRIETPAAPKTHASEWPTVEPVAAPATTPSRENPTARRNRTTVRRNSIQLAANRKLTRDAKAITDWESPTSALLSSPSDALFSSLPQLNENANGLQSFLPSRPK